MPYAAFPPPDDTSGSFVLTSSPLLSPLPFTFRPVIDLDPERRLNCHKIGVFACRSKLCLDADRLSTPWFLEGRARATQVPSGGRKYRYARTQNPYMLRSSDCHLRSQHI